MSDTIDICMDELALSVELTFEDLFSYLDAREKELRAQLDQDDQGMKNLLSALSALRVLFEISMRNSWDVTECLVLLDAYLIHEIRTYCELREIPFWG